MGLEQLTRLEVLWLVTECPLELPTSLAGTLEGLHVIGRTFKKELRHLQRWDWLQDFNQLRGLRLQVGSTVVGLRSSNLLASRVTTP